MQSMERQVVLAEVVHLEAPAVELEPLDQHHQVGQV
jgi:hypothetical protein